MTTQEIEVIGIIAGVTAMFSQVKAFLHWLASPFVVTHEMEFDACNLLHGYISATARSVGTGGHVYVGYNTYVRPLLRMADVVLRRTSMEHRVYFWRRRPLWFSNNRFDPGSAPAKYTVSFFRWSLDLPKLFWEASKWRLASNPTGRFRVVHHTNNDGESRRASPPSITIHAGDVLVGWTESDLGAAKLAGVSQLSLQADQLEAVAAVKRWFNDSAWYNDHAVPWRLGMLFHGLPGTGKTALARALAVEHDMPVHNVDISTLDNADFMDAWGTAIKDAPAVVLIEDIDCVFNGRKPVNTSVGMTFDCLLNAINGAQAAEGILLIVTTNDITAIDPALARAGRLDEHVFFGHLDHAGRLKLALRILADRDAAARAADDPVLASLSPVNFQKKLCDIALSARTGRT